MLWEILGSVGNQKLRTGTSGSLSSQAGWDIPATNWKEKSTDFSHSWTTCLSLYRWKQFSHQHGDGVSVQNKTQIHIYCYVKKHVANEGLFLFFFLGLFLYNLTTHISPVLLVFYIIKSKEFPQSTWFSILANFTILFLFTVFFIFSVLCFITFICFIFPFVFCLEGVQKKRIESEKNEIKGPFTSDVILE